MEPPICPHCGAALERVLDLPYGYWGWNGERYEMRFTGAGVALSPWACAACLTELRDFHPQDVVADPADAIAR